MIILGIETSCDETSAAVLEQNPSINSGQVQILSNIIGTSAHMQEKYGGVIPEQAAREQIKSIIPVIKEALEQANLKPEDLDAIAVTYGPGLIGSLLVGVETAKVLSTIWNKPLIPINHLLGHLYANWITPVIPSKVEESSIKGQIATSTSSPRNDNAPIFPCIGLLVSGGHSDLVMFQKHGEFEYLGGTRDDAAGECFDKCARLIGYPYPGGPKISKIAEKGNPDAYKLPRPLHDSKDYDFSFSGLKTAFANLVAENFQVSNLTSKDAEVYWKHIVLEDKPEQEEQKLADLCASIEQAIIDSLIKKTITAVKEYGVEQLIVAGGVAANQKLVNSLEVAMDSLGVKLHVPPPILCTDNAAMIAAAAFFYSNPVDPLKIQANPNLSLAY